MAQAKEEHIVYKCIDGMPQSSVWYVVKNRSCQVFSQVATKMHAAT